MRPRIKYDCSDIETKLRSEKDERVLRRLQAVMMWSKGMTATEIAQLTGYKVNTVHELWAKYRLGGVDALKSKPRESNFRKLSHAEEAEALKACEKLAEKGGYVRVAELQAEFEKAAGVQYHPHTFYRVLGRHNWRKVKPRGEHPNKASDEDIESSKKLT